MTNNDLVSKFYTSFVNGDAKGMTDCYHENIVFQDPAFGRLEGVRAGKMWEMLLASGKGNIDIKFSNVEASDDTGSANWVAKYTYGPSKRKVTNEISAQFKFKDGKIIEHIDTFDLWKWTQQAMGLPGYLLGWSGFMKGKIQKTTNGRLDAYMGA